jgi:hypothetical protein
MARRSRNDAAVAQRRSALTNEIALKKDKLTRLYRAIRGWHRRSRSGSEEPHPDAEG